MPNGIDKNLIRLTVLVRTFCQAHGHWPTRVTMWPMILDDIRALLSPEQLAVVESRIALAAAASNDEIPFVAVDDEGYWATYGGVPVSSPVGGPVCHVFGGPEFSPPARREPEAHVRCRDAERWLGFDQWRGPPNPPERWQDWF